MSLTDVMLEDGELLESVLDALDHYDIVMAGKLDLDKSLRASCDQSGKVYNLLHEHGRHRSERSLDRCPAPWSAAFRQPTYTGSCQSGLATNFTYIMASLD